MRREDFKQEGPFRWVARDKGYTVSIQKTDGSYELTIKESPTHDPSDADWTSALSTIQKFYRDLGIADWQTPNDPLRPE